MKLSDINFGDVDAKNEILKQSRNSERLFFDSFSIPSQVTVDDFIKGRKYFVLGLKGTGKTALLRYISDLVKRDGCSSELVLFKSHVTEEDRQSLSKSSGFEIINTGDTPTFVQDFKEAWKWMIYQRIASLINSSGESSDAAKKLYKLTGVSENQVKTALGSLLSKIKSGRISIAGEAYGIAVELGIELGGDGKSAAASMSDLNRACSGLLDQIKLQKSVYLLFDELELFHQTTEQFDRDRRIIRDLIYAVSQINAESAESARNLFLISSLRTEVLHSVLELGHEIGRDVDDFGVRLDWSDGRVTKDHPLLSLVGKKIAVSSKTPINTVWQTFFPNNINNQSYYKFILNSTYFRPRDIVRLLRVARDFRPDASSFSTEHFDRTSTEYSKQTWLEITEELLASYSAIEISAIQKLLLGFKTHFFMSDLTDRINHRYRNDGDIKALFHKRDAPKVLGDLYRIGVIGNDFLAVDHRGKKIPRLRWIFRGNTTLNDAERMTIHKSLWKHLSLVQNTALTSNVEGTVNKAN